MILTNTISDRIIKPLHHRKITVNSHPNSQALFTVPSDTSRVISPNSTETYS